MVFAQISKCHLGGRLNETVRKPFLLNLSKEALAYFVDTCVEFKVTGGFSLGTQGVPFIAKYIAANRTLEILKDDLVLNAEKQNNEVQQSLASQLAVAYLFTNILEHEKPGQLQFTQEVEKMCARYIKRSPKTWEELLDLYFDSSVPLTSRSIKPIVVMTGFVSRH